MFKYVNHFLRMNKSLPECSYYERIDYQEYKSLCPSIGLVAYVKYVQKYTYIYYIHTYTHTHMMLYIYNYC